VHVAILSLVTCVLIGNSFYRQCERIHNDRGENGVLVEAEATPAINIQHPDVTFTDCHPEESAVIQVHAEAINESTYVTAIPARLA
jgi:hypothetical protein